MSVKDRYKTSSGQKMIVLPARLSLKSHILALLERLCIPGILFMNLMIRLVL